MKHNQYNHIPLKITAVAAVLVCGLGARANTTPATPTAASPGVYQGGLETVAFRDSAEADQLRQAYRILATGDHDYKGHRVHAMRDVERAGKQLGMDLKGDLKDRTPQKLSDERLREAQGLISGVLNSAEVKGQKHIVKDLQEAVNQINTALSIR